MQHIKKKINKTGKSIAGSVFYGVFLSAMISLVLILLLALSLEKGTIKEEFLKTAIFAAQMISVFCGCIFGMTLLQGKKLLVTTLVLAGYFAVIIMVGIIFYNGMFVSIGSGIISVFAGALTALGVKLIHVPQKSCAKKYIR